MHLGDGLMKIDTDDVDTLAAAIDELRIELLKAKGALHVAEFTYERLQKKDKALRDLYLSYSGSTYPDQGTRKVNQ